MADFKTSWAREIRSIEEDVREGDLYECRERARKAAKALMDRAQDMCYGPYRDELVKLADKAHRLAKRCEAYAGFELARGR